MSTPAVTAARAVVTIAHDGIASLHNLRTYVLSSGAAVRHERELEDVRRCFNRARALMSTLEAIFAKEGL
jgi:hypothetical protein